LEPLQDPLQNPRDSTWQLIGVVVAAVGIVLTILALPIDKVIPALIVLFTGILTCLIIILRARPSHASLKLQSVPLQSTTSNSSNLKSSKMSNEQIKAAFIRSLVITSIFTLVTALVLALGATLAENSKGIYAQWLDNNWAFSLIPVGLVFLDLLRRVFIMVFKGIMKNWQIALIAVSLSFVVPLGIIAFFALANQPDSPLLTYLGWLIAIICFLLVYMSGLLLYVACIIAIMKGIRILFRRLRNYLKINSSAL
jgi:hypothetical protein